MDTQRKMKKKKSRMVKKLAAIMNPVTATTTMMLR